MKGLFQNSNLIAAEHIPEGAVDIIVTFDRMGGRSADVLVGLDRLVAALGFAHIHIYFMSNNKYPTSDVEPCITIVRERLKAFRHIVVLGASGEGAVRFASTLGATALLAGLSHFSADAGMDTALPALTYLVYDACSTGSSADAETIRARSSIALLACPVGGEAPLRKLSDLGILPCLLNALGSGLPIDQEQTARLLAAAELIGDGNRPARPPYPSGWEVAFEGADITLLVKRRGGGGAIVTFDSLRAGSDPPAIPFADFIETLDLTQIHVAARWNHWFQTPEMYPLAALIHPLNPLLALGEGMGGCGALWHGKFIGAGKIIAGAPQITIAPTDRPYDIRWPKEAKFLDFPPPMPDVRDAIVAIDPAELYDHAHAQMAQEAGADLLLTPCAGSHPFAKLVEAGLMFDLIRKQAGLLEVAAMAPPIDGVPPDEVLSAEDVHFVEKSELDATEQASAMPDAEIWRRTLDEIVQSLQEPAEDEAVPERADEPWLRFTRKDAAVAELFDTFLYAMRPDIVCDIGAMDGRESARFRVICPEAAIFLFEANIDNVTDFVLPRTDLAGVTIENLAVSDLDGEVPFYALTEGIDRSGHDWRRAAGSLRERTDGNLTTEVGVRSVRLDSYFEQALAEDRNFMLWIDVEGAADLVLSGGRRVLRNTLALRVEVEHRLYWQGQALAESLSAAIERQGFILLGDTYTPGALEQSDAFFLNKNWLSLCKRNRINR